MAASTEVRNHFVYVVEPKWAYLINQSLVRGFDESYAREHIEYLRELNGHVVRAFPGAALTVLVETEHMTVYTDWHGKLVGWIAESLLDGSKI